jgi:hypothetical protein
MVASDDVEKAEVTPTTERGSSKAKASTKMSIIGADDPFHPRTCLEMCNFAMPRITFKLISHLFD